MHTRRTPLPQAWLVANTHPLSHALIVAEVVAVFVVVVVTAVTQPADPIWRTDAGGHRHGLDLAH